MMVRLLLDRGAQIDAKTKVLSCNLTSSTFPSLILELLSLHFMVFISCLICFTSLFCRMS